MAGNERLFFKEVIESVLSAVGWVWHQHSVALVTGSTGSGKSNFLHVLIHALCQRPSDEKPSFF